MNENTDNLNVDLVIQALRHFQESEDPNFLEIPKNTWVRIAKGYITASKYFNSPKWQVFDFDQISDLATLIKLLEVVRLEDVLPTTPDPDRLKILEEELDKKKKEAEEIRQQARKAPAAQPQPPRGTIPTKPVTKTATPRAIEELAVTPEAEKLKKATEVFGGLTAPEGPVTVAVSTWRNLSPNARATVQELQDLARKGQEKFTQELAQRPEISALSTSNITVKRAAESLFFKIQNLPKLLATEASDKGSSPEERQFIKALGGEAGEELVEILAPEPVKFDKAPPPPEVEPVSATPIPFPSVILGAYARTVSKEDPAKASAAVLHLYGISKDNLEILHFKANSLGYNIPPRNLEQIAQIIEDNKPLMLLGAMPVITNPDQLQLPAEVFQFFTATQMDLHKDSIPLQQPGTFGIVRETAQSLLSNFFGGKVKGYIKKKIAQTTLVQAAKKVGKKVVGEVTKKGLGLAAKELVSDIAAAINGPLAPIVKALTWLVTEAVSWFLSKVWPKIKEWLKENAVPLLMLGAFLAAIGSAVPAVALMGIGGVGIIAGGAGSAGAFAFTLAAGLAWIMRTVLSEIAKPILIALPTFVAVVAFIIFIINNSAYVTPQSDISFSYTRPSYTGYVPSNENAHCSEISGTRYCFPVAPLEGVNFACSHHDYYAVDIFRNGDLAGPQDDVPMTIIAYIGGVVTWVNSPSDYGGIGFIIYGDDNRFYYYTHNERNLVSPGQRVETGQPVAIMDSSGDASRTPEHLHFGISRIEDFRTVVCNGTTISNYCITPQRWEIIKRNLIPPVLPGGAGDFKDKLDISCPQAGH